MKKIIIGLFVFSLLACNDSLKEEIEELKVQININRSLIEKLESRITINSLQTTYNGYEILFSDNTSILIENGYVPIITIGGNGNWFVDGNDTDVNAVGENGNTPSIEIGDNGNWFIDGIDTNIKAIGQDGKDGVDGTDGQNGNDGSNGRDGKDGVDGVDAPKIINILQTDEYFIFYFSDDTIIEVPINQDIKTIACWGDSLTSGTSYPNILQDFLGNEYKIRNFGVSGENTTDIAARQGGIPMYIENSFVIPSNTDPIVLGSLSNNQPFYSTHNDKVIKLLRSGGSNSINNCSIDNIECVIRLTDDVYTLERVNEGEQRSIPAKSIVFTSSMKKYRNLFGNVFFIGQNGGFEDKFDLVDQYNKVVNFSGSPNYIIIGFHRRGTVENMIGIEQEMIKEFGAHFINLREYLITNALSDAGLTPTQEDLDAIAIGQCPPQLMRDGLHFTQSTNELIGRLVYNRMINLGF